MLDRLPPEILSLIADCVGDMHPLVVEARLMR